jgi:hypothetical protein
MKHRKVTRFQSAALGRHMKKLVEDVADKAETQHQGRLLLVSGIVGMLIGAAKSEMGRDGNPPLEDSEIEELLRVGLLAHRTGQLRVA